MEALPGLREDRGLAACPLVAADNHIDVKRVDLESAADAAEGSGRGVTVSGLMAVGPSYTSSSAAPGVTHMAHPTSHRPMSLIILFSYSSHLVRTMTCGERLAPRKHSCCRSQRRLKGEARQAEDCRRTFANVRRSRNVRPA